MKTAAPAHDSMHTHLTGQSEFIDDRPRMANEVLLGLVLSTEAFAEILSIDFKDALKVDGVHGVFTGRDFHHNLWGSIFEDQPFLADKKVQYVGEAIVMVAADSPEALRLAKSKIKISYRKLLPVLSVDEAIRQKSFLAPARFIQRGHLIETPDSGQFELKGRLSLAGQEHFYLETQAAIAYPTENKGIHVHASSQHPTEVQHVVAHGLGLQFSDVVCTVKRMGGGFGGKESQASPFAALAALAAHRLKRPARLVLNRDEDMILTGKRNPFEIDYHIVFDGQGKILSLKTEMYSDGGAYADLSTSIMERAMLHCDNAYFIPNISITGTVCKTHHAPTTAFRGFGGPKGVALIEGLLEKISEHLSIDALGVRELNCYQGTNNVTPYGQVIDDEVIKKLFADAKNNFQYGKLRQEVKAFNQSSTTHLKGLALTAVKFGISFTTRHLNQGSALVNLHLDGTFQVSTGATEMGQGVNTKMAQVVAETFSIPVLHVNVMPTSTEKNHNTSPTAASSGSDLNGAAVLNASLVLKKRLALVAREYFKRPEKLRGKMASVLGINEEITIDERLDATEILFKDGWVLSRDNPEHKAPLKKIIEEAYFHRVSLGAYGFFRYPGIYFNKETGCGNPFFYFTNGVAMTQVAIDRDTGELRTEIVKILMDLGRPLNRAIDMGQISGAFVQGLGWVTTEKLHYSAQGALLTHAPSTYKIPSIQDIPKVFDVHFFENPLNTKNVLASKAVGEPPLLLALSVWCAVQNALSYVGTSKRILPIPATAERIFMELHQREQQESGT